MSLEKHNPSLLGTRQAVRLFLAVEKWAGLGGGSKVFSTEDLYHKGCTCGSAWGEQGTALAWSGTAQPVTTG